MKLNAIRTKSFCLPYELLIKRHAIIEIAYESPEELHMRGVWTKDNTVHLSEDVAFCMVQGQEAIVGAYSCGTSAGCTDHGLHQSWRDHQKRFLIR